MEIYLLRHGCTSQPGTYSGRSDVPLSEKGRDQIRALKPFFSAITFDRCWCSPLSRCRETFELLEIDSPCTLEGELQEIDFGRWEGLTFAQIEKRFPGQIEQWVEQQDHFQFPAGDRITAFNDKICRWCDNLLTKELGRVFIVSHGGVIRTAICHLLGIDPARALAFHVREGCVAALTVDDGFGRLDLFNSRG